MAKSSKASTRLATIHDQKLTRGHGGELHQIAEGDGPILTTTRGGPVSDRTKRSFAGRGFSFREKIFHFDEGAMP